VLWQLVFRESQAQQQCQFDADKAILENKQPTSAIIDEPGSQIDTNDKLAQPHIDTNDKLAQPHIDTNDSKLAQRDKLLKQLTQQQQLRLGQPNKFQRQPAQQQAQPGKLLGMPAKQQAQPQQLVQLICHNAIVLHNQITLVLNPETDDISIRQLKKRAFHLLTAAPATSASTGSVNQLAPAAAAVRPRLLAHFSPDASALFVLGGPRLQDFLHLSEINWSKIRALKFIIFHSTIAVK